MQHNQVICANWHILTMLAKPGTLAMTCWLGWAGLYWKLSGFVPCAGLHGLVYTTNLQSFNLIIGLVVYTLALLQDIDNILNPGILPCIETMIYQNNLDIIYLKELFSFIFLLIVVYVL